jgi:hypothetical protein
MPIAHRYLCLLSLAVYATLASADPASTSGYFNDPQSSHVEDATSQGIGQVNMIACIMAAMRPEVLVNKGNYNALVDESKCQPNGGSGGSSSGSGGDAAQAATYMTATVNASRASNTDPMISKIWLAQEEEGQQTTIDVHVSATVPPSDTNPYGSFRLDFCGKRADLASCRMNGYMEGSDTGIRYFETETRDDGQGVETQTTALRLNATGTSTGSGRMQIDSSGGQGAFDFAYNAGLYRRSDGTEDQCFSRDANDADTGFSVWRYGLYDASSGARVTRNSGFPIEYVNGSQTYQGYLGYYGLQLPSDALTSLTSGSTIQKADYGSGGQAPTKTDYTVVKAAGKLLKFTRQTRTLHQIDRIKFNTFVGNEATGFFAGATPNTQYELYWDDAAGDFKVTGQMTCGGNGCQTSDLPQVQAVAASFWQSRGGVQGWSQSIGGELFISLQGVSMPLDSDLVSVAYRTQDLVYPSQLPATLHCLRDCPTNATLTGYFTGPAADSPFVANTVNNWNPTAGAAVVSYHTNSTTALLMDAADQAVTFSDAAAFQQHPQYQYGVRTGRLFETLSDAECAAASGTYCDYKVNGLDVYYQWETGANSYSQFAAVKDASGQFVAFDAPLQVTFNVPNSAAYGQYAGQSLVLQYGGYGDLWGIPGHCVSRSTNEVVTCDGEQSRYVPAFVIPFDATIGKVTTSTSTYLVKWLDREIRFARKDASVCTAAGLALPSGMTLPSTSDLKNPSDPSSDIYIGAKPTVTAAPRVIHGDVMF